MANCHYLIKDLSKFGIHFPVKDKTYCEILVKEGRPNPECLGQDCRFMRLKNVPNTN